MDEPLLVVGPGAIGLALTAGFHRAGERVALLARTPASERRLAASGFVSTAPGGRATLVRGGLLSARALKAPARAAFFCVKAGDAARAAAAARRWIGPDTPAVALQNGLGHEKMFRRAFGPRRTVIGVCYFAADRPAPGDLRLNGGEDILLARHAGNAASLEAARRPAGPRRLPGAREGQRGRHALDQGRLQRRGESAGRRLRGRERQARRGPRPARALAEGPGRGRRRRRERGPPARLPGHGREAPAQRSQRPAPAQLDAPGSRGRASHGGEVHPGSAARGRAPRRGSKRPRWSCSRPSSRVWRRRLAR